MFTLSHREVVNNSVMIVPLFCPPANIANFQLFEVFKLLKTAPTVLVGQLKPSDYQGILYFGGRL